MSTKTAKLIDAMGTLTAALTLAIKAAHEAGVDASEIKNELDKFSTLLEEE